MEHATLTEDILFVAAAGDGGGMDDLYPAGHEYVMSVAAVDRGENSECCSRVPCGHTRLCK